MTTVLAVDPHQAPNFTGKTNVMLDRNSVNVERYVVEVEDAP